MKTENILIIAAGLAAGYYVGKKKEEDAAVGARLSNKSILYQEELYQDIFDNYINGNISYYKGKLNKLGKEQLIYMNDFLRPQGYGVHYDFGNRELKILKVDHSIEGMTCNATYAM